ncbi:putative MET22-protein ser/thr phosphatase [Ceraceosorus guamensis]|uniref:3'(2'),5'-bisphosphate nucleotidase n=1 Tax=Ceraceosorus guamensis TaxID=1522189 RepID=A0A316VY23_9BASI|nr:putative MET22-protein ser/thr phosphatase [Ceraceosorus guamensis]PWN42359.1 putative MET22-protein ser/thr phosphatase [Ceraceosorus guamensis]
MSAQAYTLERSVALSAVTRASSLTSRVFASLVSKSDPSSASVTKSDASPVTVGDYAAQAVVNIVLGAYFPDDPIVGEEDAAHLRKPESETLKRQVVQLVNEALALEEKEVVAQKKSWGDGPVSDEQVLAALDRGNHQGGNKGRMWALDPIDGTKGFLRGGQYAVCLGFLVDGEVQVGVMGCPNLPLDPKDGLPKEGDAASNSRSDLGVAFIAVRGQGASQRSLSSSGKEQSISMRQLTSSGLEDASFCESVEAGHSSHGTNKRIAELLGITKESVRMDSQAKYASVSRGDGDIYLRLPVGDGSYQEKIWDHASGSLLVHEAGGIVSDCRGKPLEFGQGRTLKLNRGVIAAPKGVHAEVIRAVGKALEEEGRGHL